MLNQKGEDGDAHGPEVPPRPLRLGGGGGPGDPTVCSRTTIVDL